MSNLINISLVTWFDGSELYVCMSNQRHYNRETDHFE